MSDHESERPEDPPAAHVPAAAPDAQRTAPGAESGHAAVAPTSEVAPDVDVAREPPCTLPRDRVAVRLLVAFASLAALMLVAVRLAWLGDDAFITLRTVENWASGNGMVWNPDDRVQTFTHPLWMMLLAAGRAVTGEVYFTTIGISLLLSAVACLWLVLRVPTVVGAVTTATLLLCARAFGDYMTSGLETPLTFVLLVAFCATVLGERRAPQRRYTLTVFLLALLATNRMDLVLLGLPAAIAAMRGLSLRQIVVRGLLATSPFLLWLGFALVYFGSLLPVTAHAKAFGVGIGAEELAEQGLRYLLHALRTDAALLLTTVVGAMVLLVPARTRWLAFGAFCYVGYVIKVGGDFMQGRFLLPPFVVVVASLGRWLSKQPWSRARWVVFGAVGALLAGGLPPWLSLPESEQPPDEATIVAQHGIVDERRVYYRQLGLLSPTREIPVFGALERLPFPEGREQRWFLLNGAVGSAGFGAGAEGHVVDPLLCDPLIARLPARDPSSWRIGHVLRRIPEGYWESLAFGGNRLHHDGLRRYYEALRLATRASLFDADRLGAVVELNLGMLDEDLRRFVQQEYYDPPRLTVAADELPTDVPLGTYWFDDERVRLVYGGGLAVHFDEPVVARQLQVQVFGLGQFRFRFVQAGQVYGEVLGVPGATAPDGLRALAGVRVVSVAVPPAVPQFDTVWIEFVETAQTSQSVGPPGIAGVTIGDR